MEAKKGQVLYYHEIGVIAKIIQNITKSPFNHVELCIEDNIAIQVRQGIYNPHKSGICLIDLIPKEKYLKEGEYIIVKEPLWMDMEKGIARAREIFDKVKGYSVGGCTAWLAGIDRLRIENRLDYESDDYVICSELFAKSLLAGGLTNHSNIMQTSFMSPSDNYIYFDYKTWEVKITGVNK